MKNFVAHLRTGDNRLVGLWEEHEKTTELPPHVYASLPDFQEGARCMGQKAAAVPWLEWFDELASRMPIDYFWAEYEYPDDVQLIPLYLQLRAEQEAGRRR